MKRAQGGGGSIYRDKSAKRWAFAITIGYDGMGKPVRRKVTAATKDEVIRRRNELLSSLQENSHTPEAITVATWVQQWLDEIAFHRLNPRVLADHRGKIKNYILPVMGAYKLAEVGAEEVRDVHRAVRKAGRSERTVQITHTVLNTAMRDAVREGLLDSNPCDRVDRPRARPRTRPALTATEAKAVIREAAASGDPLATLWAAALLTGARKQELLGLEWVRVDLQAGIIDLSWQLQPLPWRHGGACGCRPDMKPTRCPYREPDVPPGFEFRPCHNALAWVRPKTTAGLRLIPIPTPLIRMLQVKQRDWVPNSHGLIWADTEGRPLTAKTCTARWHEALARAGVRQIDMHSARHTTATLLLEAGVSPEVIAQLMGHSTVASTRGYLHISRTMAVDAVGQLAGLLDIA